MRVSSCHIRRSIIILAFSPRSARGSSSASFVLRFNLTEKFESPSLLAKSATGKLKLIFDVSKFLSGSNNYGLLAPMVKIGYLSFFITKHLFAV